jgi:gliding motility-associated-like protein
VNVLNGSFDTTAVSYQWSTTNGTISGADNTASIIVTEDADYTLVVTSGICVGLPVDFEAISTGCVIQKGISPNGDGYNDKFDLDGQDVSSLEIFNRYGTSVYEKRNYTDEWYGQSEKGDELPDGTYYYVIERGSGESITGWIYINRERN